jgi:hypothetical protein
MGAPIGISCSFQGMADKMRFLEELPARALTWYEAGDALFDIMERSERNVFGQVSPRLVKTGALKASLTERDADGAIRDKGEHGVRFGTTIPYARPAAHAIKLHMVRVTKSSRSSMRWVIAGWLRGIKVKP